LISEGFQFTASREKRVLRPDSTTHGGGQNLEIDLGRGSPVAAIDFFFRNRGILPSYFCKGLITIPPS
jgi:hypothetical protein